MPAIANRSPLSWIHAAPTTRRVLPRTEENPAERVAASAIVSIVQAAILAGTLFATLATRAADPAGSITAKPLAPHPFPRGKTMFVELPSTVTGVRTENRYADPKMRAAFERITDAGYIARPSLRDSPGRIRKVAEAFRSQGRQEHL